MQNLDPSTPQPPWITVVYIFIVIFSIIGMFSTLGALDSWIKNDLLYGETSISENVTVSSVITSRDGYYVYSFAASNGKGYVLDSFYTFSRMDKVVIGHTYSIRYFCNPLANNERAVMEMIDTEPDVYKCVAVNGVCS